MRGIFLPCVFLFLFLSSAWQRSLLLPHHHHHDGPGHPPHEPTSNSNSTSYTQGGVPVNPSKPKNQARKIGDLRQLFFFTTPPTNFCCNNNQSVCFFFHLHCRRANNAPKRREIELHTTHTYIPARLACCQGGARTDTVQRQEGPPHGGQAQHTKKNTHMAHHMGERRYATFCSLPRTHTKHTQTQKMKESAPVSRAMGEKRATRPLFTLPPCVAGCCCRLRE